ncbi:hypothetical protein BOX15_Mlig022197g1 [Macrostomum lignano]|uniref:Uncharacterized protein n=1 Tax=Macrostomum lignano TaxID=282301 RepID=A0A267GKK6_9PLAT|nr:hypothetical protein BOX15_Mlig022197g1 [Macrostomum lignano]
MLWNQTVLLRITSKQLLKSLELLHQQDHVSNADSTCLTFLIEQLKLLDVDKHGRRYSPKLLVFSNILFSVSSAAYQRVLETNSLALPSIIQSKRRGL